MRPPTLDHATTQTPLKLFYKVDGVTPDFKKYRHTLDSAHLNSSQHAPPLTASLVTSLFVWLDSRQVVIFCCCRFLDYFSSLLYLEWIINCIWFHEPCSFCGSDFLLLGAKYLWHSVLERRSVLWRHSRWLHYQFWMRALFAVWTRSCVYQFCCMYVCLEILFSVFI